MRTIAANILAGLSAETVRPIYLVRLDFDAGTIAWNSGYRDIVYDGKTYLGLGEITSISGVSEETGIKAASMTLGINGIKSEIVSLILSQAYLNRAAYIFMTLLDENDVQITGTPHMLFRGTIDSIEGTMGASAGFSLSLKSRLADWERPRTSRYTDAEQQKLHPGDKGCEFIAELSKRKLIWPRAAYLPDVRD